MAWTNWGFDGTINEAQWAQMAGLLGNGYVAAANGDCAVTAVSGARSVSVAAGTLYGDGIVSVNSGAETVAMTTPVNGQWFVIALRRTWATNTVALVAIAGATTSTTLPTATPTSFPTLNTNTGVLTDQPIAWAWCNSATTDVVVSDLRQFPVRTQSSTGNIIINGAFDIWQRGTTFTNPSGYTYTADRWRSYRYGFATGMTATRQTSSLTGTQYCARVQRTASNAATDALYLDYSAETVDSIPFAGKTVTVSFYARAGANYSAALKALGFVVRTGTGTDQAMTAYTGSSDVSLTSHTLSTSWQRFTVSFAVGSNATEMGLQFYYVPVGTAGAADYFEVTGIQLEAGATATPFKRASGTIQGELAACQRYYETGQAYIMAVGVPTGANYYQIYWRHPFKVTKRASATLTSTITSGASFGNSAGTSEIFATGYANGSQNISYGFDWTASAEL